VRRLKLPRGPVLLDPAGSALGEEDRRRLCHPAAGGAILFARNYESPEQLAALAAEIAALRDPPLLVATDHEGGRIQRFRAGFTALPPARRLGVLWDRDAEAGRGAARALGYVAGAELAAHGVDFPFAPVLDLDYGASEVIGDRALHFDPLAVGELACAVVAGLAAAGMAAVGKHFPGHGYAAADTHCAEARDERTYGEIAAKDLAPYRTAIAAGLAGVMLAHVIYPRCDARPAGFSPFWIGEVLRRRLAFGGLVVSDDLTMSGAAQGGGIGERARAALAAGCDMVLVCGDARAQETVLDALADHALAAPERVERMRRRSARDLRRGPAWREACAALAQVP